MAIGDVVVRIVRSDGQQMLLGNNNWRIPNDGLINWAQLSYSVASEELPSYDGSIVVNKRVNSNDRTIKAIAVGEDKDKQREFAIWFFNPKYEFAVHLTYKGRTRWTKGEQIAFQASEGNIYENPSFIWTILCPNPYLQSEGDFGKDIADVVGRFGFPWVSFLPQSDGSVPGTNVGAIMSLHTFSKNVEIDNDGDVPSGMRLKITAKGKIVNPMIRIGDGWVKILTTLQENDVIAVDASTRPPTVTLNGSNAIHLVDRGSSILDMMIDVGKTTIEYDADDGYQNMSVLVRYNKQYLGV